jgi:hypothetical protein
MTFQIGNYQIYYPTMRPNVLSPIAQILLYDTTDVYRGDLFFHRIHFTGELIPGNFYDQSSNTFQMRMHESQLASVLNTLRDNVPCFISGYDQASPTLRTGKAVQTGVSPFADFLRSIGTLGRIDEDSDE